MKKTIIAAVSAAVAGIIVLGAIGARQHADEVAMGTPQSMLPPPPDYGPKEYEAEMQAAQSMAPAPVAAPAAASEVSVPADAYAPSSEAAESAQAADAASAPAPVVDKAKQQRCEKVRGMAQYYGDLMARGHDSNEQRRDYGDADADLRLINFVDGYLKDGTTTVQRAMNAAYDNCMSAASAPAISGMQSSETYADKARGLVRPNIVWEGATSGLETVIAVHCAPSGTLLSATIQHSSGNAQWDDAALKAVKNVDPMPPDTSGKTPASFTITLRPAV